MQRPTQSELDNLTTNLQTLAKIQPGDKVNVTDKKFTIQKKGWQQSLTRTFSRNKASAYYKPIYRLFQIAVVHFRFLQQPPPWDDIRAAFLGVQRLRQTYVDELDAARKDKKGQKTLDEKSTKVKHLETLLGAVDNFNVLSTEPAFNNWIAAPRGYGRIHHRCLDVSAIRRALLDDRQHSVVDKEQLVPQQGGGEIYEIFRKDVVNPRQKLYVNDDTSPVGRDRIAWLRAGLDNDLGMLKEISALCNQGCLGGAAMFLLMQNPTTRQPEAKFLNALGMPFSVVPGQQKTIFKISAIKKHPGQEHVFALKIAVNLIVDSGSNATCGYWCDNKGRPGNVPAENGLFAFSALDSLEVDFSLSVLQFSKGQFQYQLDAIDLTLNTRPDDPQKETPAGILKMGDS
jgi:hypothetical protein